MSAQNFENCLKFTLKYEGGKSNDANDPGGRTNEGITQRTYSSWLASKGRQNADVYSLNPADRDALYREEFWNRVNGDNLRPGEDLVVWDFAVNSGPRRALEYWSAAGGSNVPLEEIINQVSARRLAFLQSLNTWRFFGPGWSRRVQACHTTALAMAQAPKPVPEPIPVPPVTPSPPRPIPPPPPVPQPIPGPVLPGTAGRQAAVLDQLLDIQGHYAAEISRLAAEKTVIDNAINQLAGLAAPPSEHPPQLTDHSNAPPPTEKVSTMFGANWQTSAAGFGTLLAAAGAIATAVSQGKMPDPSELAVILSSITSGIGLLAAKDKNVTGGTVPQTPEAKNRVH